jgi:hypothetical protein
MFMGLCNINVFLSTTNKMQRVKYFLFLSVLYMFRAVFPLIIRSSKTVHASLHTCQTYLLLPLIQVSSKSSTLAVAANNFDKYPMLHVEFLSSWWWAEKPLETCRALTTIKNILHVASYWLCSRITSIRVVWCD